jgi:hypothetical protein
VLAVPVELVGHVEVVVSENDGHIHKIGKWALGI